MNEVELINIKNELSKINGEIERVEEHFFGGDNENYDEYEKDEDLKKYDSTNYLAGLYKKKNILEKQESEMLSYNNRLKYNSEYKENAKRGVPFSDSETDIDYLSRNEYAKVFAQYIKNKKTKTPFNIGIFGEWGEGKSSFLKLIVKEIEEMEELKYKNSSDYKVHIINYNASEYSEKNKIWASILKRMFKEYEHKHKMLGRIRFLFYRWRKNIKYNLYIYIANAISLVLIFLWTLWIEKDSNNFSNLSTLLLYISSGLIPISLVLVNILIPFIKGQIKLAKPLSDKVIQNTSMPNYMKDLGEKEHFVEDLYDLLNVWLKKSKIKEKRSNHKKRIKSDISYDYKERMLLFIDDMDRCTEEGIIELLEALQLFLEVKPLVIVLSININSVIKALKKQMGYSNDELGIDEIKKCLKYLDKYINIPFYLYHDETYDNYIRNLFLEDIDYKDKSTLINRIKTKIFKDKIIDKKNKLNIAITLDYTDKKSYNYEYDYHLAFTKNENQVLIRILNHIHNRIHLTPRDVKKAINVIIIAKQIWALMNKKYENKVAFDNYICCHFFAYYDNKTYLKLVQGIELFIDKEKSQDIKVEYLIEDFAKEQRNEIKDAIKDTVVEFDKFISDVKLFEIEFYKNIIKNFILNERQFDI